MVAAAWVAALAPLTFGGATAVAAPVTTTVAGTAAEAGSVGTVVQEGGRLTVPAGEEGAVTLRFTATLPAGTQGPVSAVLRLPTTLVASAGGSPVSKDVIRSTCAVNGAAYKACLWDMPYVRAGEEKDPPSLALPTVTAADTLAYAVTMDADRTALVLGHPDARVELKDSTGTVVAEGTVGLDFVPGTPPPSRRGALHGRDKYGVLWRYEGTGDVTRPFAPRERVGGGWNAYTVVTPLDSPTAGGTGSLVARDRAGVLWYYEGTGDPAAPFAPRERVGGGWNVYTALAGTAELGRDDNPDLVARDAAGKLWLYQGVRFLKPGSYGDTVVPGPTRSLVGGGWNAYDLVF